MLQEEQIRKVVGSVPRPIVGECRCLLVLETPHTTCQPFCGDIELLMQVVFSFFLRLLICLIFAKFLLRALGVDELRYLVGLTLVLVGNIYLFDFLEYRGRWFRRMWKFKREEKSEKTETAD